METSEHIKLKPVAISLVVTPKERFVLSLDVASMPAKGPLAALSRKKYGPRKDDRPAAWAGVLSRVSRMTVPGAIITTDMHTRYPELIRHNLPDLEHVTCRKSFHPVVLLDRINRQLPNPVTKAQGI